jgi:acetylglutamate kinase
MKMSLAGSVNVDLVAAAQAAGIRALGLSAVSAGIIKAEKRPPRVVSGCGPEPVDFGEVGDVVAVDIEALNALLLAGFVPLVSSLAATQEGRVLNINGDVVACHVASALTARCLVLITGVDGVFKDLNDPHSRFPRLTISEAEQLIQKGIVAAGMIPKLEEAFKSLREGVKKVRICSVNSPGFLKDALTDNLDYGTTLVL